MLDSLSFQQMYSRFDSIVDAEEVTCDWILGPSVVPEIFPEDDSRGRSLARFSQWYFHGTGLFWVFGKPGSGKSTLLKKLLQQAMVRTPADEYGTNSAKQPVILAYFFWLNGTELQRSLTGCVKSLLWQLLHESATGAVAMDVLRQKLAVDVSSYAAAPYQRSMYDH